MEKTRLELAHQKWHHRVAKLVSPPYSGTQEELAAINPLLEEAAEEFCIEFLKDKDEAIEFLQRNRLEIENFFGDLYEKFDTPDVYYCLYNYYSRNFPNRPQAEIEKILREKCEVVKNKK